MSILESGLIALLLKATAILVAVVLVYLALRRASAATRHLCLAMAMFGVVLLPVLSLSLPAWQLEVLPRDPLAGSADASPVPTAFEAGLETGESPASPPLFSPNPQDHSEGQATGGPRQFGLAEWLVVTWALGAALVLAKLATGLLRMRSIARDGVRVADPDALRQLDECVNTLRLQVRPSLIASEHAGVPLVWGLLRPTLIVPLRFYRWTPDRMRAVMLHELGHLKRNDWPVLLLGRIVAALYWFHPLAWFVERCAKHECERACDDIVVTCGTRPSDYASHLLSLARGVSETPASVRAALAVVRRSQLNSRLRSILNPVLRRDNPSRTVMTALGTALLLVLVPLASLQLTEQAYADEPKSEAGELLAQQRQQQKKMHEHLDSQPSEGEQAYKRGYKLHSKGQYDAAIEAFGEARDLGFKPAASIYNIACCYALMGDSRRAMNWLDQAFEAGFGGPESLIKDTDFDPIRREAAFQEYIDRAFEAAGLDRLSPQHYPYRSLLEAVEKLEAGASTNGKKWHYVGSRLLSMREYDLAITALSNAVKHSGEKSSASMYNLACAYSLAGREQQALDWLEQSVDAGFDQHERFLNDTDLDNIRETAEFRRIMGKSEFLSMARIKKLEGDESDRLAERLAPLIDEYEAFVRNNPSSGRGWFNLGYALHISRRYDDAIGAFEQAASLGFRESTAAYNIACANSMLNNRDAALNALEAAVESGALHYEQLEGDSDLDNLRDEPRFRALLDRLETQKQYEQQKKMEMKKQEQITKKLQKQKQEHDD
jgi:beta-lactamase regulating signal transducer with metallopeptidase domain